MVDYGQNKDFIKRVENVDYYPDLAGIKLSSIPPILAFSLLPLWFNQLVLSMTLLVGLFGLAYWAAKREDEGRPVILQAGFVRVKHKLPAPARQLLAPTIAAVIPHQPIYRR